MNKREKRRTIKGIAATTLFPLGLTLYKFYYCPIVPRLGNKNLLSLLHGEVWRDKESLAAHFRDYDPHRK